jgi:hypothetical protein
MLLTTETVDMITILIMNLLDTLSGADVSAGPTRRYKRRFNFKQAIAAIILVIAYAILGGAVLAAYIPALGQVS